MDKKKVKKLINVLAVLSSLAGAFGMVFSFIFLWSTNVVDVVGAGFPFIAGSVLFGTGLITLAIINKE